MTSAPRTLWEQGEEPGYQVAALAVALLLTAAVLDVALGGDIGLLFDLAFVTVCATAALRVRPADFFTVGVLPPLAMLLAVLLLALADPGSVAHDDDGVVQATVSGLSTHAVALVVGYLLCLGALAVRNQVQHRSAQSRSVQAGSVQKRSGSPAPRRRTSG